MNRIWYRCALLILLFCIGGCGSKKVTTVFKSAPVFSSKKRILLCNCGGGGAHLSAVKAIRKSLGDTYDIAEVFILNDVLDDIDPISTFTFKKYKGEDLYNFFLSNGSTWSANTLCSFGRSSFRRNDSAIKAAVRNFVLQNAPDLIISVMPFINGPLAHVAQEYDIPFIVVPCDFEAMNYIINLKEVSHPKFKFGLVLDDPQVRATIAPANIPEKNIVLIGFSVRDDFKHQRTLEEKSALRKTFGVPEDKPVVMILMGGAGSKASVKYMRRIARANLDCHVLVCVGRSEKLLKEVSSIPLKSKTTMSVIGFTDRIADLMSISDVLITKPGPASIAEALYINLPMIIDASKKVLFWEQLNIDLVEKKNLGHIVTKKNFKKINVALKRFFEDLDYCTTIKANIAAIPKEDFSNNIRRLVEESLTESEISC